MRVTILAVGRLRAGPERELLDDFLQRFDRTGRPLGLGPASVVEVEGKPGAGKAAEGALLAATGSEALALLASWAAAQNVDTATSTS